YMAPEQARSAKTVDHRSDIYALGATLYHLLTGKLPYGGGTTLELIIAKETGKYTPAKQLRPEIPEKLDLIIDKMMAKDANHRYKSCDEVVRDLAALALHSDTLSFIDGAADAAGPGRAAVSGSISGLGLTGTSARTSANAMRTVSLGTTAAQQSPTTSRVWYIQFEDKRGKTTVEKHSTGRILKMIASGILTAKARAKASADGSYLPLAQFPEFADAVESSLARTSAAIRKEDMKSLYANVDKYEKRHRRWRAIKDFFRGVMGWTSLLILLGLIGVAVWLLFTFGGDIVEWGAGKFGLSSETPAATESADEANPDGTPPATTP
ncbi:MAG: hypothetical protein KDA85_05120, partial [Planctomycetaceae bacterium]|nr:hypothetical protein [Planctomycetaceae bacterium]